MTFCKTVKSSSACCACSWFEVSGVSAMIDLSEAKKYPGLKEVQGSTG
ncbi:hypothetical protein MCP1_590010 [Candidatus Terasakiella magnetica]|nr:hypothetical protein MCP1_590010 [Candidatus Terasakiella magnetica]